VNFDAALAVIDRLDGTGLDLGERTPVSPDFPMEEYRRRYARLTALMDEHGFDAIVFTQEEPVRYFTGYNSVIWAVGRWLPTAFVATRDPRRSMLAGSVFDGGCATGTAWPADTVTYTRVEELVDLVNDRLAEVGAASERIGFEYGSGSFMAVPQFVAAQLLRLGGEHPRDASTLWHAVRMLKSALEIERLRRSVGAAVAGYHAALEAARPGMTEKELVSIISSTMYSAGSTAGTRPLFVNCVSGRTRYPLVDTPASDRAFAPGDVVFVDGGGASDGYVSDILRLIGIGPLRPADRHYAEVAADATRAMVDAVGPGTPVSHLLQAAEASVSAAGISDPVGAIAGHGIGLELWERPIIRRPDDADEDVALRPGMVLCLEPILAPPHPDGGLAGIFVFEQQVVVTDTGCEVLSAALPAQLREA
jgi:Xaa-Pro aminopeptidase